MQFHPKITLPQSALTKFLYTQHLICCSRCDHCCTSRYFDKDPVKSLGTQKLGSAIRRFLVLVVSDGKGPSLGIDTRTHLLMYHVWQHTPMCKGRKPFLQLSCPSPKARVSIHINLTKSAERRGCSWTLALHGCSSSEAESALKGTHTTSVSKWAEIMNAVLKG